MEATPSLRQQGMQALQEGNLDKATDLLARAVMADDKDNDAKAMLGIAYSQKGLHPQAKRALETAVQMEPQNANYRFNLGVVLARAGEMPAAAAAYRDTLLVNPQHAQARAKMQELGQQVHQLLAAAPRLNVPPPAGATPAAPSPAAPPMQMSPPPGAPPMGGAPIGAPPPTQATYAPPPSAMPASTTDMGSGGPPGTVQCQYCFKHAKLGMVCEFCSQPLPPPPKAVAPAPTMMGPGGPGGAPVPGYSNYGGGGMADSGMDTGEAAMRRFGAQFLDGLVTTGIAAGLLYLLVPSIRSGQMPDTSQANALTGQIYGIFYGVRFGYFVILTAIGGQTLGKMALGIRVVNMDSEAPGFGRALLRETLGRLLSNLFCGLGTFWMLWDGKQQTWHDKISGTIVEKT